MKTFRFDVEITMEDDAEKYWRDNIEKYYNTLYKGDKEKIEKTLKENPYSAALGEQINSILMNRIDFVDTCITSCVSEKNSED